MIQKLKTFWRCKILKQHFFVQGGHELNGKRSIKIQYTCKLCGMKAYQIVEVDFDPIKKKGKITYGY